MFIIVLAMRISSHQDELFIKRVMDSLVGPKQWSIDLEDQDKVLRIVNDPSDTYNFFKNIDNLKICYEIMDIFDTSVGVEFPLKEYRFLEKRNNS